LISPCERTPQVVKEISGILNESGVALACWERIPCFFLILLAGSPQVVV
jgi:hypothetical protein